MKIKICGMKFSENILEVSDLLPDYLGFIFYEKSSRFFEGTIPELPQSIKKVGVFVDASIKDIISKIQQYNLNIIQLHGDENPDFITNLVSELKIIDNKNIEIIKVFSVGTEFDFEKLKAFEIMVDYFLFDTKGDLRGGNGTTFDWTILEKYNSKKPFFLSGGIGIQALENIKNLNLPIHAIDVNSKFETAPGLKNVSLCKDAIICVSEN